MNVWTPPKSHATVTITVRNTAQSSGTHRGRIMISYRSLLIALALAPLSVAATVEAAERQVLPDTVTPSHYDLHVMPDAAALTFKAEETIAIDVHAATPTITLNAEDLVFDSVALDGKTAAGIALDKGLGRATFTFAAPVAPGAHTLAIRYHAVIPTGSTIGFFAMDYDSPTGKKRTLATNFEPAAARAFLPSWDEPDAKATFSVSVDAPADQMAVGNMPVAKSTPIGANTLRIDFAETPKMSTYLLFLSIGDYERIHKAVDGVDIGVVVKRGDTQKGQYALDQAASILHYYNGYFGTPFPLPKLDLIAAPGAITGGSMENWGANFYSQEHLLFDPKTATEGDRQLVFLVVSHEMAHQWFGDLVTMKWWDNLWLNEGFARWMQTYVADALHPEWRTGLQAQRVAESGKEADSAPSTHPVLQQIDSAEQADQAFDNITYDKGAAVITMLQTYAGADAFRDGIRAYMKAHAFGNTVDNDLWSQMTTSGAVSVVDIEHDFTRQEGLPLISVDTTATGTHLGVGRFVLDPSTAPKVPAWRLPVTIVTAKGTQTQVLTGSADIADSAPLINAGATSYARVRYDDTSFAGVSGRFAAFGAADQNNLINDAWALGKSGYAPASRTMTLAAALPVSADPIVWRTTLSKLSDIDGAEPVSAKRDAYRHYVLGLIAPLAARLGEAPVAGEDAAAAILRESVASARARFGDPETVARARAMFADGSGTPAQQRAALQVVARTADAATFDLLLAKARAEKDPLAKSRILGAMAGAQDPALSIRMVDIALGPDAPAGTAPGLLGAAAQVNPDAVWAALRPHLADPNLPMDRNSVLRTVPRIIGNSADPARIAELDAYAADHIPADARQGVERAKAQIRLNASVRATAIPDIDAWVAAHGK